MEYKKRFVRKCFWNGLVVSDESCYGVDVKRVRTRFEYKKRFVRLRDLWCGLVVCDESCYVIEMERVRTRFEYMKRFVKLQRGLERISCV